MSIFAKLKEFQGQQRQKKAEKAAKLVKNPKAIREDRWAALEFLGHYHDVAVAVPALLHRFEYSLEHGINDTKEKEVAMEGVMRFGASGLPFVKEHLIKTTRIAWPIKILKELASEQEVVDALRAALNFKDVSFDQSAVDKNYDILCYLRDYKVPRLVEDLSHFLKDPDERVRYASAEFILEQPDPRVPQILESYLVDQTPENRRIKLAAITAFLRNQWKVQDPSRYNGVVIEPGVVLNRAGGLEVHGNHLQ